MTGIITHSSDAENFKKEYKTYSQRRKLDNFFRIALAKHTSHRQANSSISDEPPKKKRKKAKTRHGKQPYKQEIVELLKNNKKSALEGSKNFEVDRNKKSMLPPEELVQLKQQLAKKKKFYKSQPRFWIREHGLKASLQLPVEERIPLFIGDVQHLVLFALLGNKIHQDHNRWCHLERHGLVSQVIVVLLEGVGAEDLLKPLKKIRNTDGTEEDTSIGKSIAASFPHSVELISPETYNRSLADDFCLVPLSAKMCRNMLLTFGSKEAELKSRVFRAAFPISTIPKVIKVSEKNAQTGEESDDSSEGKVKNHGDAVKRDSMKKKSGKKSINQEEGIDTKSNKERMSIAKKSIKEDKGAKTKEIFKKKMKNIESPYSTLHPSDKFPRTDLLLSPSQMVEEGYAIPIGEMAYKYQHYVYTKDRYAEVTPLSPMFGLDCEMCLTTAHINELTRISIVDENHMPIYETLVMPHNRIINYLTQYSGITPQMMNGVKTTLKDVQEDIRRILPPDAILVGQSLNGDLHAMQMFHPYVIDSSVVFNVWGQRKKKTKLKTLVDMFLGEKIQQDHIAGHDSIEDSIAALKLVQFKLSKSLEFGDAVLGYDPEQAVLTRSEQIKKEQQNITEIDEQKDYKGTPVPLPTPEIIKIMEASSLFKLVARRKKVGMFAMPDILSQYSKYLSGHHEMAGTKYELRAGSHGFEADSNYKVVKRLLKESATFDLAVTHLKLDIRNEKQRARAINSCLRIADSVQNNGMVIIMTGGRPKNETDDRHNHRPSCFVHLNLRAPPDIL